MAYHRINRGYTLPELLVVVTVILILAAILIVGGEAVYSRAIQAKCQHRLEQIGHAIQMYSSQNRGALPPSWDMHSGRLWYQTLGEKYLNDWNVLACPSVGEPPQIGGAGGGAGLMGRENIEHLYEVLWWLKGEQQPDGHWYGKQGTNIPITGLALLTYIGFGCTDSHPPEFAETFRKAFDYLCDVQVKSGDTKGVFKTGKTLYTQGICTLAVSGVARVCQTAEVKQKAWTAAQMGLDYILSRRTASGAFYYEGGSTADIGADTSVCGWVYQAIAGCRVAGITPTVCTWNAVDAMTEQYLSGAINSFGNSVYRYYPPYTGAGGWRARAMKSMTPISFTARMVNGGKPTDPDAILQADAMMDDNTYIDLAMNPPAYKWGDQPVKAINYHNYYASMALRRMGGSYWERWYKGTASTPAGWEGYPALVLEHKEDGGTYEGHDTAFWDVHTATSCADGNPQCSDCTAGGQVYSTCMAALGLEAAFEEQWLDESWTPPGGKCSYGYNNRLGKSRRTPAGDTIIVMDYADWEIDHDEIDVAKNDDIDDIAARHGGKANALLGDGRVEAYAPDEITDGRWTMEPGD